MHCTTHRFTPLFVAIVALAAPAHGAEFCATTSAELQAALTAAQANGEDDSIRITAGIHAAPPGQFIGGFVYDAPATEVFRLDLAGGFTASGADPCSVPANTPLATVLTGSPTARVMAIITPGDVDIVGLTFNNGTASDNRIGGGLVVGIEGTDVNRISIKRSAFIGNTAYSGGGVYMYQSVGNDARVTIRNSLFLGNATTALAGGALVLDFPTQARAYLHNNTVLDNTAVDGAGGFHLIGPELEALVANNNFWGNFDQATTTPIDLSMLGGMGAELSLLHNNISIHSGFPPSVELDNISVEPVYEPDSWQNLEGNFTPARNSPLVDAGAMPPMKGPRWHLGPADFLGNSRLVWPSVDIGAYENDRIFVSGLDSMP